MNISTILRRLLVFSLVSFFLLPSAYAGDGGRSKASKLWKWSVAALLAGTAADAASSWGKLEANPALRGAGGRFSAKGLLIKSSLVGGVLTGQMLFRKNHQSWNASAWTNFALAGALGGVAMYNTRNSAPKAVPSYLQPR